jgi:hypothetical protein
LRSAGERGRRGKRQRYGGNGKAARFHAQKIMRAGRKFKSRVWEVNGG